MEHRNNSSESEESHPGVPSEAAAVAALNHLTTILLSPVELRIKNFNFFLILLGAMVVALGQWEGTSVRVCVSLLGAVIGVVFLLLYIRNLQMIKDARFDLYRLEKRFGITVHSADRLKDGEHGIEPSGRNRIISHTFCYRFVYVAVAAIALLMAFVFGFSPSNT